MTLPAAIKYAIYPGSVTLYSGETASYSAVELATLFGVQSEPYLVVNNNQQIPQGMAYFEYLHLKPRADGQYPNIKEVAQDDDQQLTWERDFDSRKKYIQETDPRNIDQDDDLKDT